MQTLLQALKSTPIIYVTRDLERALGLPLATPGYFIVANSSSFAKEQTRGRRNVLLVKDKRPLDTRELLARPQTKKFIGRLKNPRILVFKNTPLIEKICAKNNWRLLNPSATLASTVEEKISQLKWLGTLTKYLPPHKIILGKNLTWNEKKDIVQFNRAHTGTGTILIESAEQIEELKKKFPNRPLRVTKFIPGPAFTVNAVAWDGKVLMGNISYQITGLPPFTDQQFATVGNDWALANKVLSTKQISATRRIATDVGKRLALDGWRGLFGIDVIVQGPKVYLIEINARQPASTTFESTLQRTTDYGLPARLRYGEAVAGGRTTAVTVFEAHLAALLGLQTTDYPPDFATAKPLRAGGLRPISDGAQIVQRVTTDYRLQTTDYRQISRAGFIVIPYQNIQTGEDLLRIQSAKGIMKAHNEFNARGKQIVRAVQKNII